jgi:hypothetical protein
MSRDFEVDGLDDIKRLIDRFVSKEFTDAAQAAMTNALLILHAALPEYPSGGPQPGEASKSWTDKQRRWFFAALAEGKIEVPYKRTVSLGRRFTTEVRRQGVDVFGELGTNVPYAPWVVGPDESEAITFGGVKMFQAAIHQGRWWQLLDVVERNLPEAYQEFVDTFFAEIGKVWSGSGIIGET